MSLPSQDTTRGISNLFLNPNKGEEWDIVLDDGQIITVTGTEYIIQKVTQFLRFVKNETIPSGDYGIPYFEDILGQKNPDLSAIGQIFIDQISENETLVALGVTDVSIGDITLKNRGLVISKLKITVNNDTVEVSESIQL
jgi:hypothetical protein